MGGRSGGQVVGYKYIIGIHLGIAHAIDCITKIFFDKKQAWPNFGFGGVTAGEFAVTATELFGGEEREGGVAGVMSLLPGHSDQVLTGSIAQIYNVAGESPGFRGIATLFSNRFYFGMNPYFKPISLLVSRIFTREFGKTQWYPGKASIPRGVQDFSCEACSHFLTLSGTNTYVTESDIFASSGTTIHEISFMDLTSSCDIFSDIVFAAFGHNSMGEVLGDDPFAKASVAFLSFFQTPQVGMELPLPAIFTICLMDTILNVQIYTAVMHRWDLAELPGAAFYVPAERPFPSMGFFDDVVAAFPVNIDISGTDYTAPFAPFLASIGNTVEFCDCTSLFVPCALNDMNPAHILREILTQPEWGMGYPESALDEDSWIAAADKLSSEFFGISIKWDRSTTIEKLKDEVLRHINADIFVSRTSGKFVLKLIRDDYDPDTIPHLTDADIISITDMNTALIGDLTNSITVRYTDISRDDKKASVTVQDPALAQIQGAIINQSMDFVGINKLSLAQNVAARELRSLSTPLITLTIVAKRTASILNKSDPFKVTFTDLGVVELICRVVTIDLGEDNNNQIKITAIQDVFSMPNIDFVVPNTVGWISPNSTAPIPASKRFVSEAPYYLMVRFRGRAEADSFLADEPTGGFLAVAAVAPAADARLAQVFVDDGSGYADDFTLASWTGFITLESPIGLYDQILSSSVFGGIPISGASIEPYTYPVLAQLGEEIIAILDTTIDSSGDINLIVERGMLDTVPQAHDVFTSSDGDDIIIFDDDVYSNQVSYFDPETIDVKILPIMGGRRLALADAPIDSVTFAHRGIRPYPPGNVMIFDALTSSSSSDAVISGDITVSWAHRNRLDNPDVLVFQSDGDIGPEPGTTYNVRLYDGVTLLASATGLTGTMYNFAPVPGGIIDPFIELESKRDGYMSWQFHRVPFVYIGGSSSGA